MGVLLLRELAATADLPPHCVLFLQQLLELTHRWWSEAAASEVEVSDINTLAAATHVCIKMHSARYPEPVPFQLPDPRRPARSQTNLFTALAAILGSQRSDSVLCPDSSRRCR